MSTITDILLAVLAFNTIGLFVVLSVVLVTLRDVHVTLRKIREEAREVRMLMIFKDKKSQERN
jgi:hypothetical protein